jgi:hypothetical protein
MVRGGQVSTLSRRRTSAPTEEAAEETSAPTRGRRERGSEETAERSVSRGSRRGGAAKPQRGWGSYEKNRRGADFDKDVVKLDDGDERVFKFAEDGPFDVFNQHFVRELPKGMKKSYISPIDLDPEADGCGLCAEGLIPDTISLFNVIDMGPVLEEDETYDFKPVVKVYKASRAVADKIKRASEQRRTSPINKDGLYFIFSVEKNKNGFNITDLVGLKESELEEDTGVPPLDQDKVDVLLEKVFVSKEDIGITDDSDEDIEAAVEALPATD